METLTVQVESSPSGYFWNIVVNGVVVEGAPKRGHGSATKAQMIEWAEDIAKEYRR